MSDAASTAAAPPKPRRGARPGNPNNRSQGFYSDTFSLDELALMASLTSDPGLDDEIWMQRIMNRRLLHHFGQARRMSDDKLIKVAQALAIGTGRVARLMRDRRALSGGAADGLADALGWVLDELSTELGLELNS